MDFVCVVVTFIRRELFKHPLRGLGIGDWGLGWLVTILYQL
ncbi:MAG: hypothetical protein ACSI46_14450 [Gloeotrichia echinulata DVL01]